MPCPALPLAPRMRSRRGFLEDSGAGVLPETVGSEFATLISAGGELAPRLQEITGYLVTTFREDEISTSPL